MMGSKGLVLVSFLAAVAVAGRWAEAQFIECPYPEGSSVDSETECAKYSACVWAETGCHMRENSVAGYVVASDPVDTGRGFKVTLEKFDSAVSMFNEDIVALVFEVVYHEDYHVQIKIYDPENARYEVPIPLSLPEEVGTSPLYSVIVSATGSPFAFSVVRSSNEKDLFECVGPLSFEKQFLQLSSALPSSSYVYGVGEHSHSSFRHDFSTRVTAPLFARDEPVSDDETTRNQYGVQPYYVNVEDDDGNTHSVLFYNSNAMEYSTFSLDSGSPAITFRTTGGIIDFHFFLGPLPEDVNSQYANAIGTPAFPPYWSLGFHLSRYGYNSLENLKEVRQRMKEMGIPQDVQTCDIDHMSLRRDFTYDEDAWRGFPDYIDQLHQEGVKVTLILDSALVADYESYSPSMRGKEKDVFIKWMDASLVPGDQVEQDGQYMVGYVWPDQKTVFPDFMKPETKDWWAQECQILHQTLRFDAIWIDMNEPSNFGTNMDRPFNYPEDLPDWSLKCPNNTYDSPPFPTKATYQDVNQCQRLSDKTLCLSGAQSDGAASFLHYDVHSIYGYSKAVATEQAMEAIFPNKKHLIYSRSTFPGSGRYVSHWLGDNTANWKQLRMSIIGMLEFNLFGIPNVGADICGFFGTPSEELCARWMQLGAFYPFSRNHNALDTPDQDPANPAWPTVNAVSKAVLLLRYQYLPCLYTLFHKSHMHGYSVVRPLFNVFPSDVYARDVEDQFMWADKIMVAPVVYEGHVSRDVYFPEGLWYDLINGSLEATGNTTVSVDAPLDTIPVYVRGGVILPYQEPDVTTALSRLNPFGLTIAIGEDGTASGDLFWDDGEISVSGMDYSFMSKYEFQDNVLSASVKHGEEIVSGLEYNTVQFYGLDSAPAGVSVNGASQNASAWTFDPDSRVLRLAVALPLSQGLSIAIVQE